MQKAEGRDQGSVVTTIALLIALFAIMTLANVTATQLETHARTAIPWIENQVRVWMLEHVRVH